jgi:surface antigen
METMRLSRRHHLEARAGARTRNGRSVVPWLRWLLGTGLVAACTTAAAAGWVMLLKDTPAQKFQEEDLRMFLEAARDALNAEGPPKPVQWSNPKNGTGGSFLVIGESTREGMPCRRLRFSTYAPGYPNPPKSSTTWTACKNAEGRWKLADAK